MQKGDSSVKLAIILSPVNTEDFDVQPCYLTRDLRVEINLKAKSTLEQAMKAERVEKG
jgi:hypothetical protein